MSETRSGPVSLPIPDLASLRKQRGLSLEQIADATKISLGYLRAIEEGCFQRLPGGIYDLSYLRQYARAIGLDEDELIRHYRACIGLPPQAGPAEEKRKPEGWLRGPAALLRSLT